MIILSVSDRIERSIYNVNSSRRFPEVDLILGCGDLPYYYLEYMVDTFHAPAFFVHGNHDANIEVSDYGKRTQPHGGVDLHRKVVNHQGILLAGFEGSIRYRPGDHQYSQLEMWLMVLSLVPRFFMNLMRYGRALDILITHSPPWGIHDQSDPAHHGFKALRWLIKVFKPAYHFHGHVHVYGHDSKAQNITLVDDTRVINTCGWKTTELTVEEVTNRFKKEGKND
jgi:Icc-related predicted phosphoesterase